MVHLAAEAVVAGHICLDVIPAIEEKKQGLGAFLTPGKLISVGPARTSTGGAVPNTGLALRRLGLRTRLVGKIGRDLFGDEILHALRGYGSETIADMVVSPEEHTSYTLVINPPNVDRIFLHCTGANDTFTADDIRPEALSGARLFHFGYPPLMKRMYEEEGAELARLLSGVKRQGLTVTLDMARPDPETPAGRADWRRILAAALPSVDLFFPSFEEILYMLRPETYRQWARTLGSEDLLPLADGSLLSELADELLNMGAAAVAIKLGEHGLYLRTTADPARLAAMGAASPVGEQAGNWLGRELLAPCFQVEAAGTTGAGDATIAGFLAAMLRGSTVEDALLCAVGTGACSVEEKDAVGGIPSWDRLMTRIGAGWAQRATVMRLPGWQYDERNRLWSSVGKAGPSPHD
ncbi:carbohydrate kinase family protein [Cohnella caldifontis]|uniref:carbohydrate kinase family protein n=1 Tax=Cohnella caldifontis TaxID=3027471 RepID=UPI0023EC518E|nr:carbohydrate kinase family protein [Cohnella sp. YIM B05605]